MFSVTGGLVEYHVGAENLNSLSTAWADLQALLQVCPVLFFYTLFPNETEEFTMKKVAVVMGSDSDLPVVKKATDILTQFGVPFELHIFSAHRTPEQARDFTVSARENGFGCIIAAAGMAAALPGVIAAMTPLPVIGLPINSTLDGVDALLSIVQMPPGISVATVGINNGMNAVGLNPCNNIVAAKEALKTVRKEAFCPKDVWILLNE